MAINPDEVQWDDNEIIWDEPRKERTLLQEFLRQGGLAARQAIQGSANFAGMFVDPWLQFLPKEQTLSSLIDPRQAQGVRPTAPRVAEQLTRWGFPVPENRLEEVVGAVDEAVTGGGPVVKAAQVVANGARQLPKIINAIAGNPAGPARIVTQIANTPGIDAAANATGAAASEVARQADLPPWMQITAGAVAPLGVNATANAVTAGGRVLNELRRPITQGGIEQIVADTLGRSTYDRTQTLLNLAEYNKARAAGTIGVPGSAPEATAVASDPGLRYARRAIVRGPAAADFDRQWAKNNEARIEDLARLKATDEQIDAYKIKRNDYTKKMRDDAFAKTKGPVNTEALKDEIFRTMRLSKAQGEDAQKALDYLFGRVEAAEARGAIYPEDLYNGLHKDINELVSKGIDSPNGRIQLAAGLETSIKNKLADLIDEQAPGFRAYLKTYNRLSKPIDRLEVIRDRLGGEKLTGVTNSQISDTGTQASYTLSQDKVRKAVNNIERDLVAERAPPLAPRQEMILSRVLGELDADASAASGGRNVAPGSDTYQNIAAANLLNQVFGRSLSDPSTKVGAALSVPFSLATKAVGAPFGADKRIQDLLLQAFQDPKVMEDLLRKARAERSVFNVPGALGAVGQQSGGGLLGAILSQ